MEKILKFKSIFHFEQTPNTKEFSLAGIRVYKRIKDETKYKVILFGLEIFKIRKEKTVNGTKKRKFLFGLPICSKKKEGYTTTRRVLFLRYRKTNWKAEMHDMMLYNQESYENLSVRITELKQTALRYNLELNAVKKNIVHSNEKLELVNKNVEKTDSKLEFLNKNVEKTDSKLELLDKNINQLAKDHAEFSLKIIAAVNYYLRAFTKKEPILLNCWCKFDNYSLSHRNLGDELNFYMLNELSAQPILFKDQINENDAASELMFIGSVIELCSPKTVIFGAGILSEEDMYCKLSSKPKQIISVRGPLTRQKLLEQNIDCPEVYGDPALLLPIIYQPDKLIKKYHIGVIPHQHEIDIPHIRKFIDEHPDTVLIPFKNYSYWRDVIDLMNSCEIILSSGLHGLIISDAYKIPNVWCQFSDMVEGGEFKFKDYFAGVNHPYQPPLNFRNSIDLRNIEELARKYEYINFDVARMLSLCPFELKNKYKEYIKAKCADQLNESKIIGGEESL